MKTWQKMGLVTLAVIGIAAAGTQRTPLNRAFLQSHLDANNFNVTNLQGGIPGSIVAYNPDNGLMPTNVVAVSNAYVTNLYSLTNFIDNITVTNGLTNLSLTPNTVLKADGGQQIVSIPNGTGALTNDGAGNFGWNTTINGASGPWTNNTDFTWLSGFTMATNGAAQTAPFSIWTNASFFVGPDVFQDIAQDPTTVHFPYAVLLTDSNGPTTLQFSMNVYDSLAGSAFSKWFSTVNASQASATYENSIHNDKISWHMQTASDFDFSTNTVSIFHINNDGLTTANGYIDGSGNAGDLVAYGPGNRLIATNVLNLLTNVATGAQVLTNDGTYVHLIGTVTNVSSPWELANDGELLIGTNVFLGGLAPGFHVFGAVSMTDSNQPAFQFFDMVVTDDVLRKNYGIISGASTGSSASWSLFSGTDGASTNTVVIASQTGHAPFTFTVDATNRAILPYTGIWDSQGYVDESGIDGQFVSYASGKRLTPTLNGGALTNVNNVSTGLSNYILSLSTNLFFTTARAATNHWNGPTNDVDLNNGNDQYYTTATPTSITGFVNKDTKYDSSVVLTITNSAATNVTLYLPAGVVTDDGLASYVISNGVARVTSLRYSPVGYTQAVSRLFPGAGTSGTVTSVGAAGPDGFTWSAPVTGSGTLTATTPGLVLTNGESQSIAFSNSVSFFGSNYFSGAVTGPTNSSGTAPDMSKSAGASLLTTNAAFAWLAPTSVDSSGKVQQWVEILVTNSTAAAVAMTVPASCHPIGTAYVTNLTDVWVMVYPLVCTNFYFIPAF